MGKIDAATKMQSDAASIAGRLAVELGRSKPMPLRPQDAANLENTVQFTFGPDESRRAWSVGSGRLVLLVHGWGGRGVQMAALAHAIAVDGFRCVFFDAGGHGESRQERVGFHTFVNDTFALAEKLEEPVFACVGHSAGALGMMAARGLNGLAADRYICIAAPLFPYIPLETIKKNTGVGDDILEHLKPILAAQFQTDWADLESGSSYQPTKSERLLLAFDRDDERVRHADADKIAAGWPGAEVLKTKGYGHNRILQSAEVQQAIRAFLQAR